MTGDAVLSPDGRYRYALTRRWGRGASTATFVMLNPSTADANHDDPTLRRCIGFAQRWRCSGLRIVNVYGLRATRPAELWLVDDPVGPDNDEHVATALGHADGPVIAAWGGHARTDRVDEVARLLGRRASCLGRTANGAPRHPLYVGAAARRRDYFLTTVMEAVPVDGFVTTPPE